MEKSVVFNGITYHLNSSKTYYIGNSINTYGKRIIRSLHVDIYEYFSGEIVKKGYQIHHKDNNSLNNEYENLECLTAKEHASRHKNDSWKGHIWKAIEASKVWHGSKEGIEWHRQHGANVMANREHKDVSCKECGVNYKTKRPEVAEFCTTKCRQRFYRSNGIGMVDKICNYCNSPFKAQKRVKKEAVSCSRRCSVRFAIENKALIVNNKTGRFEKSRNQEDEN